MTGIDVINEVRLMTYDHLPDRQTWSDSQYLLALNDARSALHSKLAESRVTSAGVYRAYADVTEMTLSDELPEDPVYRPFLVEFMAYRFYDAGTRDNVNTEKAKAHEAGYVRALQALGGR